MLHRPSLFSNLFWKLVWEAKQVTGIQAIDDPRPLWIDWSENQGFVNVEILKQNGVLGVVGRAGRTWLSNYPDPLFAPVYNQAGELGLYRSSYHVIHTDKDIVNQTNLWYSVHPARDVVPRWIDLEVDRGDSTRQKADRTWKMVELVKARDGIYPTIYSRYKLVNDWLVPHWTEEMLNLVTWALAQYMNDRTVEHPGPPTLPDKVRADRVLYHQTADKIPGWDGSIGSSALDRDRWLLGDLKQMKTYIISNWGEVIIEPPPPQEMKMITLRIDEFEGSKVSAGGWTAVSSPIVPDGEFWELELYKVSLDGQDNPVAISVLTKDNKYKDLHLGYGAQSLVLGVTLYSGEKFRIGSSRFELGKTLSYYVRIRVQKSEIIVPI